VIQCAAYKSPQVCPPAAHADKLHSSLAVTLSSTTNYWANWHNWNRDSLQFGPQTLGLAGDVGVFGVLTAGTAGPPATPATLAADGVFLRQRSVLGTFQTLLTSGFRQYKRRFHNAALRGIVRRAVDHRTDVWGYQVSQIERLIGADCRPGHQRFWIALLRAAKRPRQATNLDGADLGYGGKDDSPAATVTV